MRYDPKSGEENPDFVLNKQAYRNAEILVAGKILVVDLLVSMPLGPLDFGIRCVIAPSFADIFFNNSFKNGLLITLPQEEIDKLMQDAENGANARLTVDLQAQEITRPDGSKSMFESIVQKALFAQWSR